MAFRIIHAFAIKRHSVSAIAIAAVAVAATTAIGLEDYW